jgi:ABC-type bacteriocin/lantibiotic exporter with double-glycine peptidase domain
MIPARQARPRRRFLAPEVIQTSAMDCGPAALKCLLEGYGVNVSYGRLREACQTSVDGTSIDTLETLAVSLGLDAEQVMMPVDHLLLPEAEALPAIVVVRLPSGLTHFVVVWRVHGAFVQVMDPARGRRWVPARAFLRDVYVHKLTIPEAAFVDWAASDGFSAPLARRMRALGIAGGEGRIARASSTADGRGGWSGPATLDAAVRTVAALVGSGAVRRGAEAGHLVESLSSGAATTPLAAYATATGAPPAEDGAPAVTIRGAVLLRVGGAATLDPGQRAALPVELRAAVDEPRPNAVAALAGLLRGVGRWRWALAAVAVALTACGAVGEALLFRALLDLAAGEAGRLGGVVSVVGALGLAVGMAALLAAIEWPLLGGLRQAGARIELALRRAFVDKIPRLPDRYFQTRSASDLAERAHMLHRLRALPTLAADVVRTAAEILIVGGALVWLAPRQAAITVALAAAMVLIPFVAEPVVAERDLRTRNHAGALARFYLDALLGLTAARAHAAAPALARQHRDRLLEWRRAARGAFATALGAEVAQSSIGYALALAVIARALVRGGAAMPAGAALLLVFWALSLPALGQELARLVQQIPAQRNATLRLLEPLGTPEDEAAGATPVRLAAGGGVRVECSGVRVVAGGHPILEVDSLAFAPGEHVALVGVSGAGKSSLVGLLLGWHRPAVGEVRVDGVSLDGAALAALRRQTVWVDPTVYLWNRSLADNLTFGLAHPTADLSRAIADADLDAVVARLPDGAASRLGEAGALVSGGEGQRVRFGRGLTRLAPRLVILDEPFRGLARSQRAELLARARRQWSTATLFCVTHDIGETEAFPRVLVVADGRVVEDGAPADLLARPGSRYAALREAEQRVHARLFGDRHWRRLRIENGRVVESDTAAAKGA